MATHILINDVGNNCLIIYQHKYYIQGNEQYDISHNSDDSFFIDRLPSGLIATGLYQANYRKLTTYLWWILVQFIFQPNCVEKFLVNSWSQQS